jgi:hypothetical protein
MFRKINSTRVKELVIKHKKKLEFLREIATSKKVCPNSLKFQPHFTS